MATVTVDAPTPRTADASSAQHHPLQSSLSRGRRTRNRLANAWMILSLAIAAVPLPAGLAPDWLRAGIASDEAGALLRSAVDASFKAGIFGSPTVVVDGEPFWGVQTLELADEWLARGGW